MTEKTKPLRQAMPLTAAWQGFPDWFHATEGEHEIGTPFKPATNRISLADCVIRSREELAQIETNRRKK